MRQLSVERAARVLLESLVASVVSRGGLVVMRLSAHLPPHFSRHDFLRHDLCSNDAVSRNATLKVSLVYTYNLIRGVVAFGRDLSEWIEERECR